MNSDEKSNSGLRLIAFLLIFAFMAFGPFYRQVLYGKNTLFRPWIMFKGKGVGVIDATFYQVLPDGRRVELNRYEIFNYSKPRNAPKNIWRIKGKSGTLAVTRKLCKQLGPEVDVRVVSRWADRDGWKPGFQGNQNLCPKAVRRPNPEGIPVP